MVRTTICGCILALLAGCSSKPVIVVGSKNFTEQVILGELIAQHIERRLPDISVSRKLNLGGTLLTHEGLKSGSLDLYPEYTGTALTAILKLPVVNQPEAAFRNVQEGYRSMGLEWLDPLGFNNTFAMVVRSQDAAALSRPSLSAAARERSSWRLGVGYEFVQRPDGLDGLQKTYGLNSSGSPVSMDLGLLYPALEKQQVDMAAASATDAQLARPGFVVLADDKQYFPPYQCAIVIRRGTLDKHPALRAALGELRSKISDDRMRKLNAAVDLERRPVPEVAAEFLRSLR